MNSESLEIIEKTRNVFLILVDKNTKRVSALELVGGESLSVFLDEISKSEKYSKIMDDNVQFINNIGVKSYSINEGYEEYLHTIKGMFIYMSPDLVKEFFQSLDLSEYSINFVVTS